MNKQWLLVICIVFIANSKILSQNRYINVKLIDSISQKPIPNVKVVLQKLDKSDSKFDNTILTTAITDNLGNVHFDKLNDKTDYKVNVEAKGYKSKKAYGTFGNCPTDFFIKLKLFLSSE